MFALSLPFLWRVSKIEVWHRRNLTQSPIFKLYVRILPRKKGLRYDVSGTAFLCVTFYRKCFPLLGSCCGDSPDLLSDPFPSTYLRPAGRPPAAVGSPPATSLPAPSVQPLLGPSAHLPIRPSISIPFHPAIPPQVSQAAGFNSSQHSSVGPSKTSSRVASTDQQRREK